VSGALRNFPTIFRLACATLLRMPIGLG